jgi:hypothetical protein
MRLPDAISLVYVGKLNDEKAIKVRGAKQCVTIPDERITLPMWLTTGPSLDKKYSSISGIGVNLYMDGYRDVCLYTKFQRFCH